MHFHDIVYFISFFVVPAYLVARRGWKGILIAAPLMWVCGIVIGGSERSEGAGAIGRFVWLVLGLGFSLGYCVVVALAREALVWLHRWRLKVRAPQPAATSAPPALPDQRGDDA